MIIIFNATVKVWIQTKSVGIWEQNNNRKFELKRIYICPLAKSHYQNCSKWLTPEINHINRSRAGSSVAGHINLSGAGSQYLGTYLVLAVPADVLARDSDWHLASTVITIKINDNYNTATKLICTNSLLSLTLNIHRKRLDLFVTVSVWLDSCGVKLRYMWLRKFESYEMCNWWL